MKTPDEFKKNLIACMDEAIEVAENGDAHDLMDFARHAHARMSETLTYIQQLEAELATVKQEQDALYSDLSTRADACDVCKHGPLYKNDCEEEFGDCGCDFEWQGVCLGNTEVQEDV